MTREEVKNILGIMVVSFPSYKPQYMELTVNTWDEMLKDYSYEQCSIALQTFIANDTKGFAPSIGQLIDAMPKAKEDSLNEMEAWAMVSKALRNSIYHADEEFEALPEVVRKAVGQPSNLRNWAQTDEDSVENVIQSNFMRAYRTERLRAEKWEKMPSAVRLAIERERQGMIGDRNGDVQALPFCEK